MAGVVPLNVLIEGRRKPALSQPSEGCLSALLPSPMHGHDLPPRGQLTSAAPDRISKKLLISRPVSIHAGALGSPPPVPWSSCRQSSRWPRPIVGTFPLHSYLSTCNYFFSTLLQAAGSLGARMPFRMHFHFWRGCLKQAWGAALGRSWTWVCI